MTIEDKTILNSAEVDEQLEILEGWRREGSILVREFTLKSFKDITSFLNYLVTTITTQNHHPDFYLDTGKRTIGVSVTTHSEKAITRADILFAQTLNAWKPGR